MRKLHLAFVALFGFLSTTTIASPANALFQLSGVGLGQDFESAKKAFQGSNQGMVISEVSTMSIPKNVGLKAEKRIGNKLGEEAIFLANQDGRVFYVGRRVYFLNGSPSVDELVLALKNEFGDPSETSEGTFGVGYDWRSASSVRTGPLGSYKKLAWMFDREGEKSSTSCRQENKRAYAHDPLGLDGDRIWTSGCGLLITAYIEGGANISDTKRSNTPTGASTTFSAEANGSTKLLRIDLIDAEFLFHDGMAKKAQRDRNRQ
ncbi:MAG TPA: hypothetical protein GXX56_05200 [Rhodocyclaceae bacterium]|nr:hypothetical protein [Rhodocyclaceae bacterium]